MAITEARPRSFIDYGSRVYILLRGLERARWLRKLQRDIDGIPAIDKPNGAEATNQLPPMQIYTDSQGALAHITGISKARTKHIEVCYHSSHDLHQRKVVKYDNVNTAENPADILTKALARISMRNSLGQWGYGELM